MSTQDLAALLATLTQEHLDDIKKLIAQMIAHSQKIRAHLYNAQMPIMAKKRTGDVLSPVPYHFVYANIIIFGRFLR